MEEAGLAEEPWTGSAGAVVAIGGVRSIEVALAWCPAGTVGRGRQSGVGGGELEVRQPGSRDGEAGTEGSYRELWAARRAHTEGSKLGVLPVRGGRKGEARCLEEGRGDAVLRGHRGEVRNSAGIRALQGRKGRPLRRWLQRGSRRIEAFLSPLSSRR